MKTVFLFIPVITSVMAIMNMMKISMKDFVKEVCELTPEAQTAKEQKEASEAAKLAAHLVTMNKNIKDNHSEIFVPKN
jgi:hypothetical protein